MEAKPDTKKVSKRNPCTKTGYEPEVFYEDGGSRFNTSILVFPNWEKSDCSKCSRMVSGTMTCEAFYDRTIPIEISSGEYHHDGEWVGDHGLSFKQRTKNDPPYIPPRIDPSNSVTQKEWDEADELRLEWEKKNPYIYLTAEEYVEGYEKSYSPIKEFLDKKRESHLTPEENDKLSRMIEDFENWLARVKRLS